MENKKARKPVLGWTIVGAALLGAALLLTLYNMRQDLQGAESAKAVLPELCSQLSDAAQAQQTETNTIPFAEENLMEEYAEASLPEEPLLEVNHRTYLGMITIPSLELELPVLHEWSNSNLKLAPCRYAGTAAEGNLILAAHNYRSHFGKISELNTGDELFFTDGTGTVHRYTVTQTELISGYAVPKMEEHPEDWDLTLFTCTLSGKNRVTVRATEEKG